MLATVFFDPAYVEPPCPSCGIVLEYGENTEYVDKFHCHICNSCGTKLK